MSDTPLKFPSKGWYQQNAKIDDGCECGAGCDRDLPLVDELERLGNPLHIVVSGQIMGGKNNICITRTGHRYPNAKWAKWRDLAVRSVQSQLPIDFKKICEPVNISLDYYTRDKRRRDMPAIVDSIFHVLEKAGVVSDDTHLWVIRSTRSYDKANPRADIRFLAKNIQINDPRTRNQTGTANQAH